MNDPVDRRGTSCCFTLPECLALPAQCQFSADEAIHKSYSFIS